MPKTFFTVFLLHLHFHILLYSYLKFSFIRAHIDIISAEKECFPVHNNFFLFYLRHIYQLENKTPSNIKNGNISFPRWVLSPNSKNSPWMRKFSLSLLTNAVNSGYDQGERCLSPMFFALLTCWYVQFSKIFAFLFSP